MTLDEGKAMVVAYWLDKSAEAMDSADAESAAGRYAFAVNRAYYACFYALSAVLLARDLKFVKHAGARSALHRHLIREGSVDASWGRFYDRAFDSRQRGDYQELVSFEPEQVSVICRLGRGFVAAMRDLLEA